MHFWAGTVQPKQPLEAIKHFLNWFDTPCTLQNRQCGYYKYFAKEDEIRGEFCYLLKSCAKRMIDNMNCPLGKNNFLEVKFFVPTVEICGDHCRSTQGCRYYWWYPIENSESPLYW